MSASERRGSGRFGMRDGGAGCDTGRIVHGAPVAARLTGDVRLARVDRGRRLIETPAGVLLVRNQRRGGFEDWSTPGGVIDAEDADLLAGLTREVEEETGLVVREWSGPLYEVRALRARHGLAHALRGAPRGRVRRRAPRRRSRRHRRRSRVRARGASATTASSRARRGCASRCASGCTNGGSRTAGAASTTRCTAPTREHRCACVRT